MRKVIVTKKVKPRVIVTKKQVNSPYKRVKKHYA